tara:strand:+ start:31334 stop:31564 length:231 start_codon:yes stop_codon:yes gene_type:complete
MNINDEGRRKGAVKARANRDSTPDVGPSPTKGAEIFARAMKAAGNRRFDEPGMEIKFKKGVSYEHQKRGAKSKSSA